MSSQARFQKSQREKVKRERSLAKLSRKEQRRDEAEASDGTAAGPISADDEARILAELEAVHKLHADEAITFDEFEQRRDELTAQLRL